MQVPVSAGRGGVMRQGARKLSEAAGAIKHTSVLDGFSIKPLKSTVDFH